MNEAMERILALGTPEQMRGICEPGSLDLDRLLSARPGGVVGYNERSMVLTILPGDAEGYAAIAGWASEDC